jgi:nucleotide-binding universal stress UspA family protein
MSPFHHILVATDGSPSCALAVDTAIGLCAAIGARLTVVSIAPATASDADLDSATDPIGAAEEAVAAVRRGDPSTAGSAAADLARTACEPARARGIEADCVVWEGAAGEAILAAATSVGADLIVVGSHSRSGLGRMVLGSVSDHVVHNAAVPVMVVRPDARTPPAS